MDAAAAVAKEEARLRPQTPAGLHLSTDLPAGLDDVFRRLTTHGPDEVAFAGKFALQEVDYVDRRAKLRPEPLTMALGFSAGTVALSLWLPSTTSTCSASRSRRRRSSPPSSCSRRGSSARRAAGCRTATAPGR